MAPHRDRQSADPISITTFVASGGVLYFAGRDGSGDTELWRSDTTAAGTYVVKNINNENASSTPTQFVEVNGRLFFTALSSLGNELWASDGTAAGTQIVKDIGPGFLGSNITSMLNFNNALYFVMSGALGEAMGLIQVPSLSWVKSEARSAESSIRSLLAIISFSPR